MNELAAGDDSGASSHHGFVKTGRRRVTPAEVLARGRLTGRYEPVSKWRVLAAFKNGAAALGLSKGLVLIDTLVGFTQPQDWNGQGAPLVWPSNQVLCEQMGIEQSRLSELLRWAIDVGLIVPKDHGSRRRFGRRDERGRILSGYGFDLSPLAERVVEFEQAAAEARARLEEAKQLRGEISALRAAILDRTAYGQAEALEGTDWVDLHERTIALAKGARGLRDPLRLVPIRARLEALRAQVEAAIEASYPVDTGSQLPVFRQPNTSTNTSFIDSSIAKRSHDPAQEGRGGRSSSSPGGGARQNASALRGFPISPEIVLQIAPAFRDQVGSTHPSWAEIQEAAFQVRSRLGISPHAYGQACVVLGRIEAAAALAAISARHAAGQVRSPGGLLRHMVKAQLDGTLQLDRTLFGLLDKSGGSQWKNRKSH